MLKLELFCNKLLLALYVYSKFIQHGGVKVTDVGCVLLLVQLSNPT